MKKYLKHYAVLICFVMGIGFMITGLTMKVPDSYISWPYEYVGGDAYNYIIESSLLSGERTAVQINKAIYTVGGGLAWCLGLVILFLDKDERQKTTAPGNPSPAVSSSKYKAQGKTLHGKEEEQFWAKIAKANEKQAEAGKKQSTWECPICGAKNDSGQMVCKECGKARY